MQYFARSGQFTYTFFFSLAAAQEPEAPDRKRALPSNNVTTAPFPHGNETFPTSPTAYKPAVTYHTWAFNLQLLVLYHTRASPATPELLQGVPFYDTFLFGYHIGTTFPVILILSQALDRTSRRLGIRHPSLIDSIPNILW